MSQNRNLQATSDGSGNYIEIFVVVTIDIVDKPFVTYFNYRNIDDGYFNIYI